MKLNSDISMTNVCKEDVVKCALKDVPNYLQGEQACLSVEGSHIEILIGKQCSSIVIGPIESSTTTKQKTSTEEMSQENTPKKLSARKSKWNVPVGNSSTELQVWISQSEDSLAEKTKPLKNKNRKSQKSHPSLANNNLESTPSSENLKPPKNDTKVNKKCTDCNSFCPNCQWIFKAVEPVEYSSSTEDEEDEIMKKLRKSEKEYKEKTTGTEKSKEKLETLKDIASYTEEDVLKLLTRVQSKLVESSIILTTQKLKKKMKKSNENEQLDQETMSDEKLLDEIEAEEGTKSGTAKLCLVLGKLVSKYVKIR